MRFSTAIFAAAAFAGIANAVEFTNLVFNNVTAGEPFTFTWSNATGPVSIELLNGDPNDLKTVETIASGQSGRSYTWEVPATLPSDTYAFRIKDSVSENYSVQTQLIGGAAASSSSASGSATASSTSSGTASATESSSVTSTSTVTSTVGLNSTSTRTSSRATGTATETESTTGTRTTASATASGTSAPAGNTASGLTSNFALIFVAAAAFMFL